MPENLSEPNRTVLRDTDQEARLLAKRLLREARQAAIATLEPASGQPLASRVSLANDQDGTPVILVSDLSSHTPALRADPRASLLVGHVGKGDPLAHSRMSLICKARFLARGSDEHQRQRQRFLNRHPKAALYADFGDFHFIRLDVLRMSLNGGFGKAYALQRDDVLLGPGFPYAELSQMEESIITHMNTDHASTLSDYAVHFAREKPGPWRMSGIDPEGIDLHKADKVARIFFPHPLTSVDEVRPMLTSLAKRSRSQPE